MNYRHARPGITLLIASILLAACGSGSNPNEGPATGTLSLQITDAPVDGVTEVWVNFSGITVNPKDGAHIEFAYIGENPINLLALNEGITTSLLDGQTLPAGEYNWIRLNVDADCDNQTDSYVTDFQGQVELEVPSAQGLQLGNGFVITANQNTSFTVDWDVRSGLSNPQNNNACYKLRPTMRIVDNTQHGTIEGTVNALLIDDAACTADVNTQAGNVVYIYEGMDIVPDDIDDVELEPDPITTANVLFNPQTGGYEYTAAFLSPGDYTVAFTCQGQDDNIPDQDMPQLETNDVIAFSASQNTSVVNAQTATVDLE